MTHACRYSRISYFHIRKKQFWCSFEIIIRRKEEWFFLHSNAYTQKSRCWNKRVSNARLIYLLWIIVHVLGCDNEWRQDISQQEGLPSGTNINKVELNTFLQKQFLQKIYASRIDLGLNSRTWTGFWIVKNKSRFFFHDLS